MPDHAGIERVDFLVRKGGYSPLVGSELVGGISYIKLSRQKHEMILKGAGLG